MSLHEIESAADALPRLEQERLYRHLTAKLQLGEGSIDNSWHHGKSIVWPDYATRLRAIYGDKAMPSVVLTERETAAW